MPRAVEVRRNRTLNLTPISLMCNSNIQYKHYRDYVKFTETIHSLIIDDLMQDKENADEVFGREPFVDEVILKAFSPERGGWQRRAHFNLVLEIYHQVDTYSLVKLRDRMKDFLDESFQQSKGWNVWVTLSKQWDVNYAIKEERWAQNDAVDHEDPEYLRLASDKEVYEITENMETMRLVDFKNDYLPGTKVRPYNAPRKVRQAVETNSDSDDSSTT